MAELALNQSDLQGATWQKLKAHYEARLATLRKQNDRDMPHEKTMRLRGRIAEVKELLALGNPKPTVEPEPFVE